MKRFTSILLSAIIAISSFATLTASADDNTIQVEIKDAKNAKKWGQSAIISKEDFDATQITKDSVIMVTYELGDTDEETLTETPIEIIFQSWSNPDSPMTDGEGKIWAKVAPDKYNETAATFSFQDIVVAYGTADLTSVDAINICSTNQTSLKCTGFKVTNCGEIKTATTTAAPDDESVAESESVTEAVTTTVATTTQPAQAATTDDSKGNGSIVWIIVGISAGVIISVVVIVLIMNKKSSKAFDVATGTYISKKNAK